MRILFTRFPFESTRGGAEHQTQWLVAGLMECGHSVSFLGHCHPLSTMLKEIGAQTKYLSVGLPPVTPWLALSFLWRKETMRKKLIAEIETMPHKPDAIFMLSLTEKILLSPWAAEKGIKVFWVEHDRIGRWLIKNPWLRALKNASASANIICVSELSKQKMIHLGFDTKRLIVIPNGVPEFPPSGEGLGLSAVALAKAEVGEKILNIGCVARLSPEKGVDVLIRAVADLPEINLTVVGTGREEGYLQSLMLEDMQRIGIKRMKLIKHVLDLSAFYSSLDAFVLPSIDHDPFGLVAAEAMMHGIATIVTDECGIAEHVENGKDALITEAGSSASLKAALQSLFDVDVRIKLAEEGKLTAKTCFSLSTMTEAYESLLHRSS